MSHFMHCILLFELSMASSSWPSLIGGLVELWDNFERTDHVGFRAQQVHIIMALLERVLRTHLLVGGFTVGRRLGVDRPCHHWEGLTQVLKVGCDFDRLYVLLNFNHRILNESPKLIFIVFLNSCADLVFT